MRWIRQVSLLTLAVVLGFGAACSTGGDPIPVIRVGHAPHDHHSPLYVAAAEPDHFRQNGGLYLREITPHGEYDLVENGTVAARILVSSSTGGKEIIRRLAENHLDLSFGGVPAMLFSIDRGSGIRIIAPVMAEGAGLVVPAESEIDSFSDFTAHIRKRGRPFRVGYKTGMSVQNLIFERALSEEGITFSKDLEDVTAQVVLVNVHGPKNLIPSMENGLIDGFVVMQPYLSLAEHGGSGKIIALLDELPPHGKWEGNPCCALAANREFSETESAAVESFLVLMMRANRFIARYPDRSALAIATWLDLPAEVEEASLPTILFTVDRTPDWERGVDFWIESMIEAGFVKGQVREAYEDRTHRSLIYDDGIYRRARNRI